MPTPWEYWESPKFGGKTRHKLPNGPRNGPVLAKLLLLSDLVSAISFAGFGYFFRIVSYF